MGGHDNNDKIVEEKNDNNIIVEMDDDDHEQQHHSLYNPILYRRGIESDAFYLILSGKVMVQSGNEGFMIT